MMLGSMDSTQQWQDSTMILASNTQQDKKKHKNKRKGKTKQTPRKGRQNIDK
jgi:hypothetical protein